MKKIGYTKKELRELSKSKIHPYTTWLGRLFRAMYFASTAPYTTKKRIETLNKLYKKYCI